MFRFLVVFLGLLMSFSTQARPRGIPPALLFHNNPIDPVCFYHQESTSNRLIQLKSCGLTDNKGIKKSQNDHLKNSGFIGFDWKDTQAINPTQGFSYYKFFDAGNRQYWLYTVNGGGGTGEFTEVGLVGRKSYDTLEMTSIMAGDRCNGGIQEVKEKHHVLIVTTHITAYDLLSLSSENPHHIKAYDDLAACAACCVGKATYEIAGDLKPQFKFVIIPRSTSPNASMPLQGKYQACFNQLLSHYTTKGKTKLDQSMLNDLAKKFNSTCITSKEKS